MGFLKSQSTASAILVKQANQAIRASNFEDYLLKTYPVAKFASHHTISISIF